MDEKEKAYWKEVKQIGRDFNRFNKIFSPSFPKPLNLQEEKQRFFRALADDKYYNPQIRFERQEYSQENIDELIKYKVSTKNDLYGFKKLYKERIKAKVNQMKYHQLWGEKGSTKYILKYWRKPSRMLLSHAKNFCKNYKRDVIKFTVVEPKDVRKELSQHVAELTGKKIKTRLVDMAAKVNIEAHNGLIEINKHERFTSLDLARLKVHEIGVHYMRYYNGNKMGIKLLELGTANYLETEEGLAAYVEYIEGVSSKAQMFVYAGRVIATHYALTKSFFEVFEILKAYGFTDQVAFAITYRAKRNLCDTSQHGGFTKDYVYFKGFFRIKKFAKKHDLRELFIGKIKIEDLKTIRKFVDMKKDKIKTIFDDVELVE